VGSSPDAACATLKRLRLDCGRDDRGEARSADTPVNRVVAQSIAENQPSDPSSNAVRVAFYSSPYREPHAFTVKDIYLGGTWARTDPGDGTWFSQDRRPRNGKRWIANGTRVIVDCMRSAAQYMVFSKDHPSGEPWKWWAHLTDDTWIPVGTLDEPQGDGAHGLPTC
jgi:hypothetical protein